MSNLNRLDNDILKKNNTNKVLDDERTKATWSAYLEDDTLLGDDDTLSDDGSFASQDTHSLLSNSTFGTRNMKAVTMACGDGIGTAQSVGGAVLYTLADATVAVGSVAYQRGRATAEMISAAVRGSTLDVDGNDSAPGQDEGQESLSSAIKEKMERSRAEREERRQQRAERRCIREEKIMADDLMRSRQEIGGLADAWRQ